MISPSIPCCRSASKAGSHMSELLLGIGPPESGVLSLDDSPSARVATHVADQHFNTVVQEICVCTEERREGALWVFNRSPTER